jgi:hypothetical protein
MAEQHGVPVFAEVAEAVQHAIRLAKEAGSRLTLDEVRAVLAEVSCPGRELFVEEAPGGFHLQVRCQAPDADTGRPAVQHGRKWWLARSADRSEIVRTAFKAVLTWQEHEAREQFTYRGARVFGPHLDVDRLAGLCCEAED